MKRLSVLSLLALAACGPTEQQADRVGVLRQANVPHLPVQTGGTDGAHLGISVGACRNNSTLGTAQWFVAGAPGSSTAFLYASQTRAVKVDGGSELGREVICQGTSSNPQLLTHGTGSDAWQATLSSLESILPMVDVGTLARGDGAANVTLIQIGNAVYRGAAGSNPTGWLMKSGTGHRMACAPGTDLCAIANRSGGAEVFDVSSVSTTPLFTVDGPDGGHNITAVAIGELHPSPGLEVAIADRGVVEVWSTGTRGGLLYTLVPPAGMAATGFGTSLAVDRHDAGAGLASLWVGSPVEARVYRFFGDAGAFTVESNAGLDSAFGYALATEGSGQLLITAPKYTSLTSLPAPNEEGAVFRDAPDRWLSLGGIDGVQQECDVGLPCRTAVAASMCRTGVCIGGVVCGALGPATGNCGGFTDAGSDGGITFDDGGGLFPSDAGRDAGVDAGLDAGLDAGTNRDAGPDVVPERDAGSMTGSGTDAGSNDPGQQFVACGCSSPALVPLLFIVLALARRRVGAGGQVQ